MTLSKPVYEQAPVTPAMETNPLNRLATRLHGEMIAVNKLIIDRMHSDIPLIPELASHLIAGGGKRIRPVLTLAAAALFGYQGTRQHRLAACVEFIHTATLLHDDVVDASDQRRGKASANAVFGNEAAVLVGDFLFSRSFQLMVEDGSLEVLRILSNASAVIAEGEVFQLTTAQNLATTREEYLRVIGAKTAALFSAACEVGGIVAGRSIEECAALREYGTCLGIAFQISDDVLDFGHGASGDRLGKSIGDDFKEGKMTLPLILALEKANPAERSFWQKTLAEMQQTPDDIGRAQSILQAHDIFEKSLTEARRYAAKGKAALAKLPQNEISADLAELIDFAVDRDH